MILADRSSASAKTYGPYRETPGSNNVLSRCANPECGKPFLKLRDGKLFLVETERVIKPALAVPPFVRARQLQRCVEHYWLCNDCAAKWTLAYDLDRGVTLVPLRRPMESVGKTVGKATSGAA
jgi:hypothetical protein